MRQVTLALLAIALIGTGVTFAAKTVSLEGIKCPLSGGPVKEDKSVAHLEGKVYFCCEKCSAKYEADKDKYAAKANQQLVATKQYEQKACPMSGGALNKDTTIKVGKPKSLFVALSARPLPKEKKVTNRSNSSSARRLSKKESLLSQKRRINSLLQLTSRFIQSCSI